MQKEELVRLFLEKKRLLTPEALQFLEKKDNIEELLKRDYLNLILTEKDLQGEEESIRIIKNLTEKPTELKTEDFIKFYSSKYEKMKNIITSRLQKNFVSLNKLDSFRNEVHVIGIVKEIKEKNEKKVVELEDLTKTVPIIFDSVEDLEADDVVAVRAISAGNVMFGKKIIYPDIPLRPPVKGFGKACFVSDLHLDEAPTADIEKFFSWFEKQEIPHLFVAGDIGDSKRFEELASQYCYEKKIFVIPGNIDDEDYPQLPIKFQEKNITSLSNPSVLELNGVKILLIHKADLTMLRKRYLGKSRQILPEDYLVLDEVPDIVHHGHTHEPLITNYKSITLVNSGSVLKEFKPAIIDLSTREAIQVNLSNTQPI